MARPRPRSQLLRVGFAILLIVSAAQVAWWMIDQWRFSAEVEQRLLALHTGRVEAARQLLAAGRPVDEVSASFPEVVVSDDFVSLSPEIAEQLARARARRINRYLWEGGFFLVVLVAGLAVIDRALRDERALRRRQDSFLAVVSHELKSPLAVARVAADTLALRDEEAARVPEIGRIRRSLARLETMIGNLLDTARIEAGELVLEPSTVPVADALAPVTSAFRERATHAGVELEVSIEPHVEARVDVLALRAVIRNLLDNAFDAVSDRSDPRVELSAATTGGRTTLVVEDNGCGFDPAGADRLFDKFYRPGDEMRRGGRGAGLGLHIVAAIVARSGGRVEAASEGPGRGATVRVCVPAGAAK